MKFLQKSFLFCLTVLSLLTSCSETDEVLVDSDWVADNEAYTEKIAAEAKNNVTGDWKIFLPYGVDENIEWPVDGYVYCKVKQAGTSQGSPFYNDVVLVNYKGRLINDAVFDSTYSGDDPATGTPVELQLEDCVRGFITALQEMVRGDLWEVYIPASLAYGMEPTSLIPAGSMLIFTVELVDFTHNGETE